MTDTDDEPQTQDSGLTQREKRRQQHQAERKPALSGGTNLKQFLVPALIVGGLALIVGMMALNQASADDCPGHWHSNVHVYVDDERVDFNGYNLENGRTPLRSHLHRGNDALWHWEPNPAQCIEFGDALSFIDMELSSKKLTLDGAIHENTGFAGTYENDGNRTVHIWTDRNGDNDWQEISASKLKGRQQKDGERTLIAYGDYTSDQIAAMQDGVPFIDGSEANVMNQPQQ